LAKDFIVFVRGDVTVMQSGKDRAIGVWKLPIAIGFDGDIVAQDGSQAVEVASFMGRGNPAPVAVSVRNFGEEGRGGISRGVSSRGNNQGDEAGMVATASRNNVRCFMGVPFSRPSKHKGAL